MTNSQTREAGPDAVLPANRERKIVRYGTISVEVILNGSGGPPVVLIPSWGRDSEELATLAELVAQCGFRVMRPVPRGAGESDGPVEGVSMHDLARDVAAVIEWAGGTPAIVAGHAFGSYVARAVSAQRPDLVCGLVLLAAGARGPAPPHLVEAVLKSGDLSLSEAERLEHLSLVFFAPGHDARIWLGGWNPTVGVASASAFRTPPSEYWEAGTAPVLDLIAMQDPLRPSASYDDIRSDLGHERVEVALVPNASHAVVMEQTERVAAEIVRFARKVTRML